MSEQNHHFSATANQQGPVSNEAEHLPDVTAADLPESLDWKRAHPLSPLVNVWLLFIGFLFFFGRETIQATIQNGWRMPENTGNWGFLSFFGVWGLPLFVFLIFLLALAPNVLSWWFTKYAIDQESVHLKRGVFVRSTTRARLERVQAIDIEQPFFARILGLAELKFEVADGSSTLLSVRFLKKSDANALRDQLLRQALESREPWRRSGSQPAHSQSSFSGGATVEGFEGSNSEPEAGLQSAPVQNHSLATGNQQTEVPPSLLGESHEQQILKVNPATHILSMLLSLGTIIGLLFFGAFLVIMFLLTGELIFTGFSMIAVIFGAVSAFIRTFNNGWNFRVSHSDTGLKLRYGFTSTTTQTVPTGRIQQLSITQPLLWRYKGWFKVKAMVAGYGAGEEMQYVSRGTLMTVGTGQDLMNLLPYVLKDRASGGIDGFQLRSALEGSGSENGFTSNPPVTRYFDWFTWKRNGFARTESYLLIRSGRFTRSLQIVPHEKVQSVNYQQGIFDRKLGLATVWLYTAGAPGYALVHNVDAHKGLELASRQAELAARQSNNRK